MKENVNWYEIHDAKNDESLYFEWNVFKYTQDLAHTPTSKNESSPLSLWEAMSMEKAIVSTEVGDVKKFVKNSINGFTSEVGNVNNLSKKIRILVDKPQLRKKFGKKSRQISKNKLDIKICGKLHLKAYKDIAN